MGTPTCSASLLDALRKTLGNSLVPGSILNLCLISFPSHVKLRIEGDRMGSCQYLTKPVATSTKQPTKSPVEGGLPDGSLLTSAYIWSTLIR